MPLSEIKRNTPCSIPFKWLDDTPGGNNLGHCEFAFVLKIKKDNNIGGFYVFLLQHRNVKSYLYYASGDINFVLSSYEGLDRPETWMIHGSTQPKGVCFHAYTPKNSKFLNVDYHGVLFTKTANYEILDLTE